MPRTRPRPSAHSAASPLPARPGVAQDRSRRWVVLAYGSLALMVLVLTMPYRVGVADTFVQLRIGEYILQHGIPHIDPFSYMSPFAGHPYVEHEWLTCILFSLLYQYLGVGGLVLYRTYGREVAM